MALKPNECVEIDADGLRYTERPEATVTADEVRRLREQSAREDAAIREFNAGYDAYLEGVPQYAEPDDVTEDMWLCGWAWAAFEPLQNRVAKLEAALQCITELRPIDALGSPFERAQALARKALDA